MPGRISTDFDQSQDFNEYQTFAWAAERPMVTIGNRIVPPSNQAEVADAIKADLTDRGYVFAENVSDADFAVSFTIGTRDGSEVIQVPDFVSQNRANWGWVAVISLAQYR